MSSILASKRANARKIKVFLAHCLLDQARMNLQHYLVFLVAMIAIALSPGPAVILITTQGLRRGPLAAARGALGIISVNAFYFILAALGLGIFIEKFQKYFSILILSGVVYLLWLAFKLWVHASPTQKKNELELREKNEWKEAALTQLSNPKAILFFTALLPQFIDPSKPILMQILIIGFTSFAVEFPVLFGYGYMGHLGAKKFGCTHFNFYVDRVSACLLITIAAMMVKQVSAGF